MIKKVMSSSYLGVLLIAFVLLFLSISPQLFTQRKFSFSEGDSKKKSDKETSAVPLSVSYKVIKPGEGKLSKIGKSKVSLQEIFENTKAEFLMLNFWATWCPPCVEEFPSLEMLSRQLNRSTETVPLIVTFSVDERAEDISRFYKTLDFSPSLFVLHDIDGELARSLGTTKFPETYLINKSGKIVHKWIGGQRWLAQETIDQIHRLSALP